HLAAMLPDREGLQVFMPHEETSAAYKYDTELRDARTGEIIFFKPQSGSDIGRGIAANISDKFKGYEYWAASDNTVYNYGQAVGTKRPSINFRVYWDGDLLDELLDGTTITKPNNDLTKINTTVNFSSYSNAASCNSTKATPNLQADLFGDWREEVILHDSKTESDLLIFTTTIPSDYKVNTLMQDRQYRVAVAWQNVAYNQPPHLSYNLEELFNNNAALTINSGATSQIIYVGDEIQPIAFTVSRASGAECDGLPEGMTFNFDPSTLTGSISGKPAGEGEYTFTVSTTGADNENDASFDVTIKVRKNTSVQLVAYYPFETVGETVANLRGGSASALKGVHGEAVAGKQGNALVLNGSNCYVQDGYDLINFGDLSFTVELWMNSTAADKNFYLFNKGVISPDKGSGNWYGVEYKNKELRFAVDDNINKNQVVAAGADKYFDGEWHHVVGVRDAAEHQLRIYVDGELVNSADDKTVSILSDEPLVIGNVKGCDGWGYDNYYIGMLD
ncbi:MAG: putative Ig domain-containing protein, partial [Duncaniella sp.]|nr:putative Ig domain-containing protein [Duncaniella sp.]